jgi:hypothetical protein
MALNGTKWHKIQNVEQQISAVYRLQFSGDFLEILRQTSCLHLAVPLYIGDFLHDITSFNNILLKEKNE